MLEWSNRYIMGIDDLDQDHLQLFKISRKMIDTVNEGVNDSNVRIFVLREGIKYLRSYFDRHALREESYMREHNYPDYALHKKLHDEFQDIQLVKYENIIESGACTKEQILDFVGTGIGWLLEHIATADMAIVGRGVLSRPKSSIVNRETFEAEVNALFISILNLDIKARIIDNHYSGDEFGDAVYQQLVYTRDDQTILVNAGIEKCFLLSVARMIYGDDINEADALILSTFEIFSAGFWKTFATRLMLGEKEIRFKENHFLTLGQLRDRFIERQPFISLLFESTQGKFFVSSNDEMLRNIAI